MSHPDESRTGAYKEVLACAGLSIVACMGGYASLLVPGNESSEVIGACIMLVLTLGAGQVIQRTVLDRPSHRAEIERAGMNWRIGGVAIGLTIGFVGGMALSGLARKEANADVWLFGLTATVVAEEVVFRGIAWRWLRGRGALYTIAWTSVLFTAIHIPHRWHVLHIAPDQFVIGMLTTLAWAIVFGVAREYWGIGSAIACHFGADLAVDLGYF